MLSMPGASPLPFGMLATTRHGDVTRLHMSTATSRAIGYSVSAFVIRGVLVDTGFPAVAREVAGWLEASRPRAAILTHHHEDHAGNAPLIARAGIPIAAADATAAALRAREPIGLYRRIIWGTPDVLPAGARFESFVDSGLRLVPTPGHSADHHAVWDEATGTLFAGDLFLGVKVRLAHPGESPRTLVASLRRMAALEPARLFDAHRGPVADPAAVLRAKADWIEEMIAAVESGIEAGLGDRAIARRVLGREPAEHYVSRGKMSKINFVRAVRREWGAGGAEANDPLAR